MTMKKFKNTCNRMTAIIESCWDENNPDDGKTFDERLKQKCNSLPKSDLQVMKEVLCW